MTAEELVDAIQRLVVDRTGPDTISVLRTPPGRRPATELVELSHWFNALSDNDKGMIERLLAFTARNAVFGVFDVLDGVRKVDPAWAPGDHFELRHVHGGSVEILSGPEGAMLHELL